MGSHPPQPQTSTARLSSKSDLQGTRDLPPVARLACAGTRQIASCVDSCEPAPILVPQPGRMNLVLALVLLLADESEGHCRVCPDDVAARFDSGDHDPRLMADGCGFYSFNCVIQSVVNV